MVGLSRFELLTPRLSSVCSNQLSYRPDILFKEPHLPVLSKLDRRARQQQPSNSVSDRSLGGFGLLAVRLPKNWEPRGLSPEPFSRKEVIQPQVLLQLPCYDFTPITDHTLGASLPLRGWYGDF